MDVKYDQHFLTSKNILQKEAKLSEICSEDVILEIGPGDGRLCEFVLQEEPSKLISIEMDSSFEDKLKKLKEKFSNFEVVFGNGLEKMDEVSFNKIVSNIPYSITEPLYIKMMEKKVPFALLLHGANFYKLILDENSKWHYFVNAFYDVELILEVAGNAFEPIAKTMSVLLRLRLKEKVGLRDEFFRHVFLKRKRSVLNCLVFSLVDLFDISKKDAKAKVMGLDLSNLEKKVENLSNEEFRDLVLKLNSLIEKDK